MKSEEIKFLVKTIIPNIIAGLIVFIILLQISELRFLEKILIAVLIIFLLSVIVINLKHSKKKKFKRPRKTIKIQSNPNFDKFFWNDWGTGGDENTMGMLLTGVCEVKNIVDFNIWLITIEIKGPRFLGSVLVKIDMTNSQVKIDEIAPYKIIDIPKKTSAKVISRLSIIPAVKEKGKNFKTDIAFIDQFGNRHWRKNVEFVYDDYQKLRREVNKQSKFVVP